MSAFAGTLLGLPLIPPFNNPKTTGSHILQGVNFASAASGILDDTGRLYVGDPNTHTHHPALIVRHTLIKHGCHDQGNLFSMDDQIANFNITLQQLNSQLGDDTGSFLAESLFFLNMGSNDYVNNYLLPFSDKPKKYTPEAFNSMPAMASPGMPQPVAVRVLGSLPPYRCLQRHCGQTSLPGNPAGRASHERAPARGNLSGVGFSA
ncbi:hypothetical protein BHM03_00035819 [Ensete ventricosum]|nr:hypothetical protein BHM03_00035819 [Ensete ventricosum]